MPSDIPASTPDLAAENLAKLKALFPDAVTEDGINADVLRQLIGKTIFTEAEQSERYGLNWFGKKKARQIALTPSSGTLRPCPEDSVDWDTTQNLMIEGDNLEVLKLLQKSYSGKVKLIYIDPPYNTGKDFVYPDDFRNGVNNYLQLTGQKTGDGRKIETNTESSGRFHTDWLNMMYPRLKLARNLLREDGVVFISISDTELSNLTALCNDVFGEGNHLATFIAVNEGNIDNQSRIKVNHEYIIGYAKNETEIGLPPVVDPNIPKTSKIFREEIENTVVQNGPGNPVSSIELPLGFPADFDEGSVEPKNDFWPRLSGSVRVKAGRTCDVVTVTSGWKCKTLFEEFIANGFEPILDGKEQQTVFYLSKTGAVFYKKRRLEQPSHVLTVLRGLGTVQAAAAKLSKMGIAFSYPKPTGLIGYLIQAWTSANDVVLDFFAGSGTTGEAAMKLSVHQDSRKFILVQLPEPSGQKELPTIAKIAAERLRRASKEIRAENPVFAGDLGFRVFKLDESNIVAWDATPPAADASPEVAGQQVADLLAGAVAPVKADRTPDDLLFEVLLKCGIELTAPVALKKLTAAQLPVHAVDGGLHFACLAGPDAAGRKPVTGANAQALADGISAWSRELGTRVLTGADTEITVFLRDDAFDSDDAKANLIAALKQSLKPVQIRCL